MRARLFSQVRAGSAASGVVWGRSGILGDGAEQEAARGGFVVTVAKLKRRWFGAGERLAVLARCARCVLSRTPTAPA